MTAGSAAAVGIINYIRLLEQKATVTSHWKPTPRAIIPAGRLTNPPMLAKCGELRSACAIREDTSPTFPTSAGDRANIYVLAGLYSSG